MNEVEVFTVFIVEIHYFTPTLVHKEGVGKQLQVSPFGVIF